MPRLSNQKKERIKEQILLFLFSSFPKQFFTSDIAREIARDEEYIKKLLLELESKDLVVKINRNPEGILYEKRLRWRISNKAYSVYNSLQSNKSNIIMPE